MKLPTRSTSIDFRVAVLVGMVAAGCGNDNRGVGLGKTDGGVFDAAASPGGQTGSTSSQGGTAGASGGVQNGGATGTGGGLGTKSTSSAGGSADTGGGLGTKSTGSTGGSVDTGGGLGTKDTGSTGGSVGTGGGLGTKSTGGVTLSGGTIGSGGAKGGSIVGADAAVDVSTSDGGGKLDGAADAGAKDATSFETRAVPDSSVAVDGNVVCGPVCNVYCSYGNVLDANGCPTCACNVQPTSCALRDCMQCPRGYLRDSSGCLTCTCVPDPSLPCNTFQDVSLCSASTHCRWLAPGCGLFSSNDISASETGCYEAANCTQNSDCSKAGTACVQRTVNPHPPFEGGDFCNIVVSVCL
jgi:hypothetical protein